jgi:hypothetical protein
MLQDSPLQWTCEHVYGHQDTKQKRYKPLSRLARLNVSMDHTAKWFWTQTVHSQPHFPVPEIAPPIQHEGWHYGIDRKKSPTLPRPISTICCKTDQLRCGGFSMGIYPQGTP